MDSKCAVDGLIMLRVEVRRYKGVVVLSPREDVTPVAQVICYHGEAVSPRLYGGLHVMQ
jgi:hypothetical protein